MNVLSPGSKYSHFKIDTFTEEIWCAEMQQKVTKVVSLVTNGANTLGLLSPRER